MKQKQVIDVRPSKEMTIAQSNEHLRMLPMEHLKM